MKEIENSLPERRVTIDTYYGSDDSIMSLVLEKASTRFDGERADGVTITLIDEEKKNNSLQILLDKERVRELIMDLHYMIGRKYYSSDIESNLFTKWQSL